MKILLVTSEFPPFKGGVSNYYYNLASHFPYDDDFSIIHNNNGELDSKSFPFSWLKSLGTVWRRLKKNKFDYVLAGQILPFGTVLYILSFFKKFKFGVFLHGMDFSFALKSPRKRFLCSLILNKADKIITANSYVAEEVIKKFPKLGDKIIIINPGLPQVATFASEQELNELRLKYNLEGKVVLFSLGRLVKRKGFDRVIESFKNLNSFDRENLVYVIAGKGPDEVYLRSLVPNDLRDQIIFLGLIGESDKWSWLNLCDIFIMPARNIDGDYEGFGIVYLEANLCAKPVIAGLSGGVGDAVSHNLNGLLVDPEDINSISQAILSLKNNKDLREKLGQQGKERAEKEFAWEKLAHDLRDLLD